MENIIGDPATQQHYWELQDLNDNCAVAAQTSIINQFLDHPVSLDDATYVAMANGWYTPGAGTQPDDVGQLMEYYGIPCHEVENATILQLAQELQQGHRVVVGLNSDQLWDQGPGAEFWNWTVKAFGLDSAQFTPADHAVTVTGLDLSDPQNPHVIINDSGNPDGAGQVYPLDRFMDAWENGNFNYVATSVAPTSPSTFGTSGDGALAGFDIGDFLGIGTTLVSAAMGVDIVTAAQAGLVVNEFVDNPDWDTLLANV